MKTDSAPTGAADPTLDSAVRHMEHCSALLARALADARTLLLLAVRKELHGRWLGSYSGTGAAVVTTIPGAAGRYNSAERVRLTYFAGLGWKAALGFACESEGYTTGPAAAMVSLAVKVEDYSTEMRQQILARVKGSTDAQG